MCRPIRTRCVLSKTYFDVVLVARVAAPKHAQSKHVWNKCKYFLYNAILFFALKYDQIIRDQTSILSSRNAHVYLKNITIKFYGN